MRSAIRRLKFDPSRLVSSPDCRLCGAGSRGAFWSFPPPALGECRQGGLAGGRIAMRRRAIFVIPKDQRPHPRRPYRSRVHLHDPAHYNAIAKHVEIIVTPLTG
jgi:hypothetical protein